MLLLRSITGICAALLLSGCFVTKEEPFSLENSDNISQFTGLYSCTNYTPLGEPTGETKDNYLVEIKRNKLINYVMFDVGSASDFPMSFHKTKGDLYAITMALPETPGEAMVVMHLSSNGDMTWYDYFKDTSGRAKALAAKYRVTIAPDSKDENRFAAWELEGPLAGQKAFLTDMASSLEGWIKFKECLYKAKQ